MPAGVVVRADPITVRRETAAELLGVGLTYFKDHIQPHIPCVREGRTRLYRPSDLEAWAEANLDRSHLKDVA